MAGIATTMSITDKMLGPLQRINAQLSTMKSSFDKVDTASEAAFSVEDVEAMRNSVVQMINDVNQVADQMNEVDNNINKATSSGGGLEGMLKRVLTVAGAIAAVRFTANFVKDTLELASAQNQVETQLSVVLKNMGAEANALDLLREKASALQQTSLYGDEAYLAGAAELSTYMKDAQAVSVLMGTLSNYATGMSGGGKVDINGMTDYATQLGKVLIGSYDGIKKKGFELSDAQKEIIENGTDMQKALVIDEVISEGWDGLAESMANTPYGKIEQMANAWGDIKENVGNQLYPAVSELFDSIQSNMPGIIAFLNGVVYVLNSIIGKVSSLIGQMNSGVQGASENWQKLTGTIASVTGVFNTAFAFIHNGVLGTANGVIDIVVTVWNVVATIVNFFTNLFTDFVGSIGRLFVGLGDTVLAVLEAIANAIDWVFGSNLGDTVSGWRSDLNAWSDETFGKGEETMKKLNAADYHIGERTAYSDALMSGYEWGEGLANAMGQAFEDAANDAGAWGGMLGDVSDTASNTASLAGASEATLAYLKDIAEREAINKFTTAEVKVELGGVSNTVNSNMDTDGFVDYLAKTTSEALAVTAAKSSMA